MKHKRLQPTIILGMVSIAFFVKGISSKEMAMIIIGCFVLVLTILRLLLVLRFSNSELDEIHYDDMIEQYLKQDTILYIEMLEIYQQGNADVLYGECDGILLYDKVSFNYHATASSLAAVKDIIHQLPQDYGSLIVYDDIFVDVIEQSLPYHKVICYYNHLYEGNSPFLVANETLDIRRLDETYVDVVRTHYTVASLATDAYIKDRIAAGMMGAFIDDELVGYIGMHPSGPVGMLEVFDSFRGQKIGISLQASFMNTLLAEKRTIFSQVNENNHISLAMQEKLKLKKADRICRWYIEK